MYPWRYVRDHASEPLKRERRIQLAHTAGILTLILVAYVISPVIHETGHTLLLRLFRCHYTINYTFEVKPGLSSEIAPMCGLNPLETVLVFGAGITAEMFFSFSFFAASFILLKRSSIILSDFMVYSGAGFSINPILYFFQETGDLVNILAALSIPQAASALPYIGAGLAAAELVYVGAHFRRSLRVYRNISNKVRMIEDFLEEIKAPEDL